MGHPHSRRDSDASVAGFSQAVGDCSIVGPGFRSHGTWVGFRELPGFRVIGVLRRSDVGGGIEEVVERRYGPKESLPHGAPLVHVTGPASDS